MEKKFAFTGRKNWKSGKKFLSTGSKFWGTGTEKLKYGKKKIAYGKTFFAKILYVPGNWLRFKGEQMIKKDVIHRTPCVSDFWVIWWMS